MALENEPEGHGQPAGGANPVQLQLPQANVEAVQSCLLPTFSREAPDLWFLRVESAFIAHNIRADSTKFHLVVSKLDTDSLQEVVDLVRTPSEHNNKYATLKDHLLRIFAEPADHQLRDFLTNLLLGNKRPSQLLRIMRTKANNRISDDVLRIK